MISGYGMCSRLFPFRSDTSHWTWFLEIVKHIMVNYLCYFKSLAKIVLKFLFKIFNLLNEIMIGNEKLYSTNLI